MKTLTSTKTNNPDFSGFEFYVEAGEVFDLADYCDAYGLNPSDVDMDSVKAAQHKAGQLNPGEWLHVEHD